MSNVPPPGYGQPAYGAPTPATRPAELLDRFLARLIDGLIVGIPFAILNVILSAVFIVGIGGTIGGFLHGIIATVLMAIAFVGYFAYFESTKGQTFGKQIMKLRVVAPNGGLPTMEQSVKRNVFNAISVVSYLAQTVLGLIPFVGWILGGLLGFVAGIAALGLVIYIAVTINQDPAHRQGWHDKFAGGTYVLKEG